MNNNLDISDYLTSESNKIYDELVVISPSIFLESFDKGVSYEKATMKLLLLSFPLIISFLFLNINNIISLYFIWNYLGDNYIPAFGYGNFYVNIIGYIFGIGILHGADTVYSHAKGGKIINIVYTYLKATRIILLTLFLVIILPCLLSGNYILSKFNFKENITSKIDNYIYTLIPHIIFSLQFYSNFHFLYNIGYIYILCIISLLGTIIHILSLYYFSYSLDGIGLAISISSFCNFIMSSIFIEKIKDKYTSTHIVDFELICDFLKLAIPSALIYTCNCVSYELIIIFSSILGNIEIKSAIFIYNLNNLIFSLFNGISLIGTSIMGALLSQIKINTFLIYTKIIISITIIFSFIVGIIIFFIRNYVLILFTDDIEISKIISNTYDLIIPILLIFSFQCNMISIVKSIGYQKNTYFISLLIVFFLHIPITLTFIFLVNMRWEGIWWSLLSCNFLISISYSVSLLSLDMNTVATRLIMNLYKKCDYICEN